MDLTVLGAGPAYSDRPGSTGASYLLQSAGSSLLLDLGQGSFPALASTLEPSTLDAIVISHLHPDHFIDLVSLRHYLVYELDPSRRLTVFGPDGLAGRLDALHASVGFTEAAFDVVPLRPGTFEIGPFTIQAELVTHTPESDSFGFRVSSDGDAAALVYSGDCGNADDLRRLVCPGDTLLTEVSFGPGPIPPGGPHIDGPAVGSVAASTGAGRVLLTHLQMGYDRQETLRSVAELYGGPLDLVDPGFQTII
jgi:ribonuclease BN (tRNA processing enzyme)